MSAPMLHPISAKSPIEWARAEAVALDQHAARMEASHGPNTKGAPLCRSRAAALRWLVEKAEKTVSRETVPTFLAPPSSGCPVCNVGADGKPMSYTCTRQDCPWLAR